MQLVFGELVVGVGKTHIFGVKSVGSKHSSETGAALLYAYLQRHS